MAEITTFSEIPCSASVLREFLGQTKNLLVTSEPDLQLEILAAPEIVSEGELIEFRISAYGFKQRMAHRYVKVTDVEIVAEQTEGPARAWRHFQIIEAAAGDEACRLTDRIEFEPPGGMLGFVMTEDKISESIEEGMTFRYEALTERFGGS